MLPNPNFSWVESENGGFLHWRYGCLAVVRAKRDGFCEVEIRGRKLIRSRAGSMEQGKRHIER